MFVVGLLELTLRVQLVEYPSIPPFSAKGGVLTIYEGISSPEDVVTAI